MTMLDIPDLEILEPTRAQWRLSQVQVLNWGTFHGLHVVPVARKGQLITGASGSGKSSLLDGIAAVLTPDRWLQLNAAAQGVGGRGDRSIVSYVRGAWSKATDETQDRVVNRVLRGSTTLSGILLRYEDGNGAVTSVARVLFLKGTSTDVKDLRDACVLEQGPLDLEALRGFVSSQAGGIDARSLKAAFPKAVITTNRQHAKFYARLGHLLGIGGDNALQLLHRTQSAKNLGSLDHLFRSFMLDRPETFRIAESAVEQFGELDAAHKHVVELRRQRDALVTMREHADRYEAAAERARAAAVLRDLVAPFEARTRLRLARQQRNTAVIAAAQARAALDDARAGDESAADDHRLAQLARDRAGGADLAQLDDRIREARRTSEQRARERHELRQRLERVGVSETPTTEAEFASLRALAGDELRRPEAKLDVEGDAVSGLSAAKTMLSSLDREIEAFRRSRSSLDPRRLAVRERLAKHLRVPEAALPFAGELLDVAPAERRWTGAVERVLRPLATTLLVPTEHLAAARRWIDETPLGVRLVYEAVAEEAPSPRGLASDSSLVRKLIVSEGRFQPWLTHHLAEQYDIACVETADELHGYARAVTIRGQVKRSPTRYEKDDTHRVDDPTRWVLGAGEERLEALLAQRATIELDIAERWQQIERQQSAVSQSTRRREVLTQLLAESWERYDVDAARARVSQLERQRESVTHANTDLASASRAEEEARAASASARAAVEQALEADLDARRALEVLDDSIAADERAIDADAIGELQEQVVAELERRFRERRRRVVVSELAATAREVESGLGKERERAIEERNAVDTTFTSAATAFCRTWPAASANLTPFIDDRAGFRALLASIEAHDLPSHEQSFRTLLREKSSNVVGYLRKELLDAPKEVRERIEPVNDSLARSEFDRDRFLRIRVKLTRGETVSQFMKDLAQIADGSWNDEDAVSGERRFGVLAALMAKLASSEPADRKWREACLDTRLHVSFLAEVVDRDGLVLATYDSGASLSGGQQQKLVVFCLAAALRYQLTEEGDELPRYGTVILDEAFDKADSSYTRMAMDVFVEFGFHMVLATPLKLLQTLEPYIGGVVVVQNPTEQQSTIDHLGFDA